MNEYRLNYAIFASGRGSNALSLIDKGMEHGCLPKFLFVNKESAAVIEKARGKGVQVIVRHNDSAKKETHYDQEIVQLCREHDVDWILLAGYMKIVSTVLIDEFTQNSYAQIINIHPSLLPKYKGLDSYRKAFDQGDRTYGFSIHIVDEKIDNGPILFQRCLHNNDDEFEAFKQRSLVYENKDYACFLEQLMLNNQNFINALIDKKLVFEESDTWNI